MKTLALILLLGSSLAARAQDDADDENSAPAPLTTPQEPAPKPGAKAAPEAKPLDPVILRKAQKFCVLTEGCNKANPGKSAMCLKKSIRDSGLLSHALGGEEAKDLPRFLRREGFVDVEMSLRRFSNLPDGAILVLDAHDTLKDHKTLCPKVYGNVLVKCGDKWVDDQKNDLDFHMKRGCRTKGIWLHPDLISKNLKEY